MADLHARVMQLLEDAVQQGAGGVRAGGASRRKAGVGVGAAAARKRAAAKRRAAMAAGVDVGAARRRRAGVDAGRRRRAGADKGVIAAARNPWIEHVRNYAYEHGITYGQAMMEARETYIPVAHRR
jgi:hypothetical protein